MFAVTGCKPVNMLEPDVLPPDQIKTALVHTPSPIYRNGKDLIVIRTIDGKLPTFMETKAIVSPGVHSFQIAVELHHESGRRSEQGYITKADTSLRFDVEANGEYLIVALEDEHGVWVWVTDLNTKFIVAGDPPRSLPKDQRIEPMWRNDK